MDCWEEHAYGTQRRGEDKSSIVPSRSFRKAVLQDRRREWAGPSSLMVVLTLLLRSEPTTQAQETRLKKTMGSPGHDDGEQENERIWKEIGRQVQP